jgi:hypothetical protein
LVAAGWFAQIPTRFRSTVADLVARIVAAAEEIISGRLPEMAVGQA